MDAKDVIARFEAERQALTLMDHLDIANVHAAATLIDPPFFGDDSFTDDRVIDDPVDGLERRADACG